MKAVMLIGPSKKPRVYRSLSAASRALTGTGSTELRFAIAEAINAGGGRIGNVFVTGATGYKK